MSFCNTLRYRFVVTSAGLFFLCLLPLLGTAQMVGTSDDSRIEDEFIVMLKPAHKVDALLADLTKWPVAGKVAMERCLSERMNIYLLKRINTVAADEFLLTLNQNQHIKLAQFNHRAEQRSLTPNDPQFTEQWNMLNTTQLNVGVAGADIDAPQAWELNHDNVDADGDTVVVAVIDDFFDLGHEDLNFFTNYNEVGGNGIDDDGNGYIDDVNGWNAKDNNGNVNGTGNHPTHCAGIVGAIGNNGKGVAGVCWGAKIMAIRGSSVDEAIVIEAYAYVIKMRGLYNTTFGTQGAYIVATNSSFGVNAGIPANFPIWCAMYDTMGAVGILSATATTNSFVNIDDAGDIPTQCPSKWMIAVTNTNQSDINVAGYGLNNIDLGAPGQRILSTVPNNNYGTQSGTSMATPHVAGTIAAMFSAACKSFIDKYTEYPDSFALQIKNYLLQGAEWNTTLNHRSTTNGRLNLFRAVSLLKQFDCDSCGFNASLNAEQITCKSADNGTAEITVSNRSVSSFDILWSDSSAAAVRQQLAPGFYTATITDTLTGCSRFVGGSFYNPDSIIIQSLLSSPPGEGAPGTIVIQAKAGNEPLMYSINAVDYQLTSVFSVPDTGTYSVYIKNSSGCIVQRTITIVATGIGELDNSSFSFDLYPNPAESLVTLYYAHTGNHKTLIEIFDITGRKVFETTPVAEKTVISTQHLQNGVYLVKAGSLGKKLIVVH